MAEPEAKEAKVGVQVDAPPVVAEPPQPVQSVGLMTMPRSRVVGKWITARSDMDQALVRRMAQIYFEPVQWKFISETLGKPPEALAFDAEESQILNVLLQGTGKNAGDKNIMYQIDSRSDDKDASALLAGKARKGITQFYDFCATLDELRNRMRLAHTHLTVQDIIDDTLFEKLESEIMYPDMIPLGIRRKPQINNIEQWSLMTSITKYPTKITQAAAEAILLSSSLWNDIQALSQGLFRLHSTDANVLHFKKKALVAQDDKLESGQWINGGVRYEDGLQEVGQQMNALSLDAGESHVDYNSNDIDDLVKFVAPKNVQRLPSIYHLREVLDAKQEVVEEKKEDSPTKAAFDDRMPPQNFEALAKACGIDRPFNNGWPPFRGGAIALNFFLLRLAGENSVYERRTLTLDDIHTIMRRLYFHPISSCPELSRAHTQSGSHDQLMDMMRHLQRALEAAERKRRTFDRKRGFNVTTLADAKAVAAQVPQCGPGLTAQFYRFSGHDAEQKPVYIPVPEDEALVSRDGNIELASHVARDKIECVPRVTVAQLAGRSAMENLRFHPVLVPEMTQRPRLQTTSAMMASGSGTGTGSVSGSGMSLANDVRLEDVFGAELAPYLRTI